MINLTTGIFNGGFYIFHFQIRQLFQDLLMA